MVTLVLLALAEALASGRRVELRGIGSFRPHLRPARVSPNVPPGRRGRGHYDVPARTDIRFIANRELRHLAHRRRRRGGTR